MPINGTDYPNVLITLTTNNADGDADVVCDIPGKLVSVASSLGSMCMLALYKTLNKQRP